MAKPHFWDMVDNVIAQADVVLEVLDARMVDETRNEEIEKKIKDQNKKLIHVVNKIDLVYDENYKLKLKKLENPVFVSSLNRLGTTILKKKIMEVGRKDIILVGVVGYPNTGKSSVINALAGAKKAKSSPTSGMTKKIQKIKASNRIFLLDTPGVIPLEDRDQLKHTMIAAKNAQAIKEPDIAAVHIIHKLKGRVERHYKAETGETDEETLENIALKMHRLLKGGKPDIDAMSRTIIMDWQRGNLE